MALWKVNNEIVYSENALSLSPNEANGTMITRHFYKVPKSNVRGGFLTNERGTFHTPSWIKVHPKTTLNDIIVSVSSTFYKKNLLYSIMPLYIYKNNNEIFIIVNIQHCLSFIYKLNIKPF